MNVDIAIVGGGLAGLALATALRRTGLSLALIEGHPPRAPDGWDGRIYAISPANAGFLTDIGAWQHLDPARRVPVAAMEVYGDGQGRLDFSAYASGVSELAWIIESWQMQHELWETAKRQGNLQLLCPARPSALSFGDDAATLTLQDGRSLQCKLVVAADGADSWTRQAAGIRVDFTHYEQSGVVANFQTELAHHETAFQWFRDGDVLAWLPLPDKRMSMVWSTSHTQAKALLSLSPEELSNTVADAGGRRLGRLNLLTPPAAFPLRLMRAPRTAASRLALIGDAAHAIHPLSGHGINLGFQDARALADVLVTKPAHVDCGDVALLRRYERERKEEVVALQTATDGLHRLFRSQLPPLGILRNFGLNLTNHLPVVKDALVRYALAS